MSYQPFIEQRKTQFGELTVAQKSQEINLKSIYGVSALRDVTAVAGSATVTNATGEYKLTTTASGTDSAILDSAERGRYVAGQDALAGLGVRVAGTISGNIACRWGYYDDNDGFGYGQDATGVFIFDRTGGTETKVYQSNWNGDKLDGTGQSGHTLNTADGYIYQVQFAWYGYGSIQFEVQIFDSVTRKQTEVVAHVIRKTGSVSIEDPNLPLRAEVKNNATATAFDSLYVGGRQFSTLGEFKPAKRITSERRLSVAGIGTTPVPLVSFRRKANNRNKSIKPLSFDVITNADVIIEVRKNGVLTGASYITPTNHSAAETGLESDISATAISNGQPLFGKIISSSGVGAGATGGGTTALVDIDMINEQPITVTARAFTGTATVSCMFRMVEEW